MLRSLSPLWRDPVLRLVVLVLFLSGAQISSMAPYLSFIAISRLGFSDQSYSFILIISSLVGLGSAVGFGILTDQRPLRRQMALLSSALVIAGAAVMWLWPGKPGFIVSHMLLLPSGFTIFVLVFALSSLASQAYPQSRDVLLAAVRAGFALPFVVVLPLWAVALNSGADVMAIYPFGTIIALISFVLIWRLWPKDRAQNWHDAKSGISILQSLSEMTNPQVLLRVILLGAVASGVTLYIALIGLVFTQTPGRDTSDAALFVGLVAGAEVPFMLAVPQLLGRIPKVTLIALGTALYAVHLVTLPWIAGSGLVWLLILPASLGGAIILTLPIAYLQDLLADRPGAGSSLISVQRVAGDTLCAAAFALGSYASGYAFAAALGASVSLIGAVGLVLADRSKAVLRTRGLSD